MSAGKYAQKMALQRAWRASVLSLTSFGSSLLLLSRGVPALISLDPVAVLAATVAVIAALAAKQAWRSVSQAERGATSEVRVQRILERSRLGQVLSNVDLSAGGDADHIVVYGALVVVETKTGRGAVSYTPGALHAGGRKVPGDPVRQANRQAAAIRKATGHWTTAVVCVTDMSNAPFRHDETIICSASDLVSVLKALPPRLSPEQQADAVRALAPGSGRT